MRGVIVMFALLLGMVPLVPQAAVEAQGFDDPLLRQRYQRLVHELRCLVCQNQNLAESSAALAGDLRRQVYEMVVAGRGEREIADYMVARYGDFVLYRPPLRAGTVVLWAGPFAMLAVALAGLFVIMRRGTATAAAPLNDDDRERLRQLLGEGGAP